MFIPSFPWRSLAVSIGCIFAAGAAEALPVFDNIYLLGDSLSDQGNLFAATKTLRGAGVPADDHYYNGRFSNGEVYSGLLAQRLGLSLTASSSGGNNFAYGGTRNDYNIVEGPKTPGGFDPGDPGGLPAGAYPWTLKLQKNAFVARGVSDPNALYVVFSGSNDVGDLLQGRAPSASAGRVIGDAVQGIIDVVDAFKAAGAQYILVPDIPDLGVVPSVAANGPRAVAGGKALSSLFNSTLHARLGLVTGVKIINFNTFDFVDQVNANPVSFGLTEASRGCYSGFVDPDTSGTATVCANPDSYAYFDKEHPTRVLHSILADRLLGAVVPEPGSCALVLAALAALGLTRRRNGTGAAAA